MTTTTSIDKLLPHGLQAKWAVYRDDDGAVRLQIELGQDYAVLVSCDREDGARVTLWHGSGEGSFGKGTTPEGFGSWLDEVVMAQE
jgi:hypothetical protein